MRSLFFYTFVSPSLRESGKWGLQFREPHFSLSGSSLQILVQVLAKRRTKRASCLFAFAPSSSRASNVSSRRSFKSLAFISARLA